MYGQLGRDGLGDATYLTEAERAKAAEERESRCESQCESRCQG
jgi:hypothetical protein